jgi:hypothetical protein
MNTFMMILSLIPSLIKAIAAVEEVFPQSSAGAAKLDMVKNIMTVSYSGISEAMPIIEKIIGIVVTTANNIGAFKK